MASTPVPDRHTAPSKATGRPFAGHFSFPGRRDGPPVAQLNDGTFETHRIRLGIGRAVYAYRLAYGELSESLEVLVKAGLMSPRYRSDENDKPLRSRCEGDYLVVESTGPEPWTCAGKVWTRGDGRLVAKALRFRARIRNSPTGDRSSNQLSPKRLWAGGSSLSAAGLQSLGD